MVLIFPKALVSLLVFMLICCWRCILVIKIVYKQTYTFSMILRGFMCLVFVELFVIFPFVIVIPSLLSNCGSNKRMYMCSSWETDQLLFEIRRYILVIEAGLELVIPGGVVFDETKITLLSGMFVQRNLWIYVP